jgi:hypothetical protein
MQILVSRSGLVLNPGQVADLVLAWRQIAGLIASMPRERPLADDMALTFRVPSSAAEVRPIRTDVSPARAVTRRSVVPSNRAVEPKRAPKAKQAAKPKPTATEKRVAAVTKAYVAKSGAKPKAAAKRASSRRSAAK